MLDCPNIAPPASVTLLFVNVHLVSVTIELRFANMAPPESPLQLVKLQLVRLQ